MIDSPLPFRFSAACSRGLNGTTEPGRERERKTNDPIALNFVTEAGNRMKKEAGRRRRKKWDTARQRRNKTKMFFFAGERCFCF